MWIPKSLVDWITTVKLDEGNRVREELAGVRAERDAIKTELTAAKITSDWLRMQVNTLQLERNALMEKAYSIKVPVPTLVRQPVADESPAGRDFSFDDIGDDMAKRIGLPVFDTRQ